MVASIRNCCCLARFVSDKADESVDLDLKQADVIE